MFVTPKPERLLRQILTIATNPGDIVCDPFLGSGTTAAVAHKMGRRYIGVEMGEHAITHCVPRLKKVIEGEQGGISKLVNWPRRVPDDKWWQALAKEVSGYPEGEQTPWGIPFTIPKVNGARVALVTAHAHDLRIKLSGKADYLIVTNGMFIDTLAPLIA